jgi:hypothetical protein
MEDKINNAELLAFFLEQYGSKRRMLAATLKLIQLRDWPQ